MTNDKQDEKHWHLSKTINISHLVTSAILVVGSITYIGDIEQDVAILQVEQDNIKVKMAEDAVQYYNMFGRIETKLDKLFDLFHSQLGK